MANRTKYILTAVVAVLCTVAAAASPPEAQRWEGGIKVGLGSTFCRIEKHKTVGANVPGDYFFGVPSYTFGSTSFYENSPIFGFGQVGAEVRYNFPHTGWDAGVEGLLTKRSYRQTKGSEYGKVFLYGGWYVGAVSNYNFRQGSKINPYAGVGIGIETDGKHAMAAPRVGVELFYHLRVEVGAYLGHRDYNMVMVSLGGVIGGRPRKAK